MTTSATYFEVLKLVECPAAEGTVQVLRSGHLEGYILHPRRSSEIDIPRAVASSQATLWGVRINNGTVVGEVKESTEDFIDEVGMLVGQQP